MKSQEVDLSRLPPPNLIEALDFETIFNERKAALIALYPDAAAVLTLESEPLTKLLQENAYREVIQRQRINERGAACMLAFSQGTDLDHLVANFNVQRFVISPANPNAVPPTDAVLESDNSLRARGQRAFEGLSVAGPRSAYIFHALSADARVADASAISPLPCEVVVSVLANDGDGSAPADLLSKVRLLLSGEDVRPVGDRLTVQSASIVNYAVTAVLYLYQGPEKGPILEAAHAQLKKYISTQRRMGRDIRQSAIFAALHVEGVQRVELVSPAKDVVLDETQAAHCTAVEISVGGIDD
ncbi:baseplate assembly protein [Janthinobacterium sp. B9-8]|uniref:baseplate assembly protein n=1 Tax=Janthinobacterium sp. B9-8 TaxID=1236179 RepID=UPI00061D0650|nr:baseplate J/gp47 family protein [Janthinobacterium sp. B9-8]AMC35324.1 baseplate assembly protein [Janthinobacterium sp. B9-8]